MIKPEGELIGVLLALMNLSLIVPMASLLIRKVLGKGIGETGKKEEERFLRYFHYSSSIGKRFMRGGKGVERAGKEISIWIK